MVEGVVTTEGCGLIHPCWCQEFFGVVGVIDTSTVNVLTVLRRGVCSLAPGDR